MANIIETYLGGLRVECEHALSGTKIITDAPIDHHGQGRAFSPTDLCCASLGACVMTIIGIWADSHDVDVKGARVEINKHMDSNPRKIAKIELVFHMPNHKYSLEERQTIEAMARTAPVPLSLNPDVEQVFTFIWPE